MRPVSASAFGLVQAELVDWLKFNDMKIDKLQREKAVGHYIAHSEIDKCWTPIKRFEASIPLPSKIVSVKRSSFPVVVACTITIQQSHGSTYPIVVYEYSKVHEQQLVYVALSWCSSYEGLFLTNSSNDFKFNHGRKNVSLTIKQVRTVVPSK